MFVLMPIAVGLGAGDATQLEDGITIDNQTIPLSESAQLSLPPLPAKRGKVIVLRFRATSVASRPAGCNYNASVVLNGAPLGRFTAGGDERLIGREPMFAFVDRADGREFQVFSGPLLMVMFAPDTKTADAMTKDGLGGTFVLNISDVARGVDGNTLTIRNTRRPPGGKRPGDLVVENIEIGWLERAALPQPKSRVPHRGTIEEAISAEGVRLSQGKAGGFAVRAGEALELLVETGLGMVNGAPSCLVADDTDALDRAARVEVTAWGTAGYQATAVWEHVRMKRTVELRDGLVEWKECWTNTGDEIRGVPFRHRVFLRDEPAKIVLAGDTDVCALASSAKNPTVFLESKRQPGRGFGITAESDWLRLLMWLRAGGGVGEIYSQTLALAPRSSIDFRLTIEPVRDGGGYWTFINRVRERWGVNGYCVERPTFWGYWRAPDCKTPEERIRKSLGHLGPVYLVHSPWTRLEPDARVVRAGRYPKLPAGSPPMSGKCPDLDVEEFLTFKHREPHQQAYARNIDTIRRVCPHVRVIQMMHPAMEVVYRPLWQRWSYAAEAILTADGKPFESHHYSKAWLYDYVHKDWGVLYYCPRPGSAYLSALLESVRRSLDDCGSDGIYCDEFSWAGRRRGYSRYDYSRWDGYSADLDENGNVAHLKSDNAAATESCQLQIVNEVLRRGKFFLGNGTAALRSVTDLAIARFVEGGNGYGTMAGAHLSTVPLVLGNLGDRRTTQGVFESVKLCLSNGCIYSPSAVNLLLDGPDNFVCKLYPIAVREIGPGWVKGEGRLATTLSGEYDWPGRTARVRICRYDSNGSPASKNEIVNVRADKALKVDVPRDGLVIGEVID